MRGLKCTSRKSLRGRHLSRAKNFVVGRAAGTDGGEIAITSSSSSLKTISSELRGGGRREEAGISGKFSFVVVDLVSIEPSAKSSSSIAISSGFCIETGSNGAAVPDEGDGGGLPSR